MTNEEKNKAFDAIAAEALKAIEDRGTIVDYPADFVMGYVTSLQDKDGDLVVEIHGLKQEISKLEKKLSEEFRFNTNSNRKNKDLTEALDDLQRRFDEQSDVLKSYHAQGKKDRDEIETLSQAIFTAQQQADRLLEDRDQWETMARNLGKELETAKHKQSTFPCAGCTTVISDMVNEKDGKIAAITDQLRQAERDRDFNRDKINQLRGTINSLSADVARQARKITELKHPSALESPEYLKAKIAELEKELTYRRGQILSTENSAHGFTEGSDLNPGGVKLYIGGHEITGVKSVKIGDKTITVATGSPEMTIMIPIERLNNPDSRAGWSIASTDGRWKMWYHDQPKKLVVKMMDLKQSPDDFKDSVRGPAFRNNETKTV